jgi:hypothetical protein
MNLYSVGWVDDATGEATGQSFVFNPYNSQIMRCNMVVPGAKSYCVDAKRITATDVQQSKEPKLNDLNENYILTTNLPPWEAVRENRW